MKQAEQDAKLAQLEAAVLAVLRVSEGIRDDLSKAGITTTTKARKAGGVRETKVQDNSTASMQDNSTASAQ